MPITLYDGWYTYGGEKHAHLTKQYYDYNARKVYYYFIDKGWTLNAICGMLGNMWTESHVDPQEYYTGSGADAYGLVQWNPKKKLTDFAARYNLDYRSGNTQVFRIQREYETHNEYLFWKYPSGKYKMTWDEYVRSYDTPENLATQWWYHYEVGGTDETTRRTRARYFYDLFSHEQPPGPDPDPPGPDPDPDPPTPGPDPLGPDKFLSLAICAHKRFTKKTRRIIIR